MIVNNSEQNKDRRNLLPPFLVVSILLHLILFALFAFDTIKKDAIKKANKEKENYIEITDLPVPKEKETEPPKETKRLANRSHKTEKETTRDEVTKLIVDVPNSGLFWLETHIRT